MMNKFSLIKINPDGLKSRAKLGFIGTASYLVLMAIFMVGCSKEVVKDPIVASSQISTAIAATFPANLAETVVINPVLAVTFTGAASPADVSASTMTLKSGDITISGKVTYSGKTATFTPSCDLKPDTKYEATIKSNDKGSSDNQDSEHSWTFKTGKDRSDNSLTIVSVTPLDHAVSIPVTVQPTATFSDNAESSSVKSSSFTVKHGNKKIEGSVSFSGNTATFTPDKNLIANTIYTCTIMSGTNSNGDDNSHGKENGDKKDGKDSENKSGVDYTWSFSTGDDGAQGTAPAVISVTPANNATAVAVGSQLTVVFSVPMDPLTINSSTLILTQGTTVINGTVTYSGITATFTPNVSLAANTVYTGTITTGAKDLAGNPLANNTTWSFTTAGSGATSSQGAVNLGTSANYVILAQSAITNIATSAIVGDMGISPAATSYITGFSLISATGYATSSQVTGNVYGADMAVPTPANLTTAVNDMNTAYVDAAGRTNPDYVELASGNIGGQTLVPGLYKWSTGVIVPTDVTISGGANDVWIFQIAGTLTSSSAVNIILSGGAQAKNIFWQVAGQVTLGTTTHFEGIILAKTGITLQTGASVNGRALAQTAVVLDQNAVSQP